MPKNPEENPSRMANLNYFHGTQPSTSQLSQRQLNYTRSNVNHSVWDENFENRANQIADRLEKTLLKEASYSEQLKKYVFF